MSKISFTTLLSQIREELLSLDRSDLNKKIEEVASGDMYDLLKGSGFFAERENEFSLIAH